MSENINAIRRQSTNKYFSLTLSCYSIPFAGCHSYTCVQTYVHLINNYTNKKPTGSPDYNSHLHIMDIHGSCPYYSCMYQKRLTRSPAVTISTTGIRISMASDICIMMNSSGDAVICYFVFNIFTTTLL